MYTEVSGTRPTTNTISSTNSIKRAPRLMDNNRHSQVDVHCPSCGTMDWRVSYKGLRVQATDSKVEMFLDNDDYNRLFSPMIGVIPYRPDQYPDYAVQCLSCALAYSIYDFHVYALSSQRSTNLMEW